MSTVEQLTRKLEALEPPLGAATIENFVLGNSITQPGSEWVIRTVSAQMMRHPEKSDQRTQQLEHN